MNKLWGVHLNDQNGIHYDQDKIFGVENLRNAFNQVKEQNFERLEMYVMELLMGVV